MGPNGDLGPNVGPNLGQNWVKMGSKKSQLEAIGASVSDQKGLFWVNLVSQILKVALFELLKS